MDTFFTQEQKSKVDRVKFLKNELAKIDLPVQPCVLLMQEINKGRVLMDLLAHAMHDAENELKKTLPK